VVIGLLFLPFILPILLLFCVVFLFVAVVYGPRILISSLQAKLAERRFRDELSRRGRCIAWEEVAYELEAGSGTLIFQWAHKSSIRAWWTPDDVTELAPHEPPSFEEIASSLMKARNGIKPDPFIAWCHERYLDDEVGSARLTKVPRRCWPRPAEELETAIRRHFPRAKVVETGHHLRGVGDVGD
jgi:hypothetical protein